MRCQVAAFVVACLYLAQPLPAHAVTINEMVEEIMGAPVYASAGHEVGAVVDVSVSDDGEIDAVRFRTGRFLGFDERVLHASGGNFTALRGAVVLDVPAEALEALQPTSLDAIAEDRE